MATLRQDVWFGESPRFAGLRLGPFRNAPVRILLHPHRAASAANPKLMSFAEHLADRVEVVLLRPRSVEDASAVIAQWRDDFVRVIECLDKTWNDRLPLVLVGVGVGGALALALAGHPAVRAAAALAPYVPRQMTWPAVAGGDGSFDPVALDKPVLIIAPREEPRLDRPRLEAAVGRWAKATWIAPSGTAAAAVAPMWAGTLAEWALAATRD
jgi:pimeloyl-ACP methyl ester carboxylesterase